MLGSVAVERFGSVPFDFTWTYSMASWAQVAVHLGDREAMQAVYDGLAPFADQVVVCATVVSGAVSHHLGVLAAALDELDQAEEHFAAAAATHERMSLPTWVAHTALERGAALLRRNQPGDRELALPLLQEALAAAVEYELGEDECRARQLLASEEAG